MGKKVKIKVRRTWKINPQTRIVLSKKRYNRKWDKKGNYNEE